MSEKNVSSASASEHSASSVAPGEQSAPPGAPSERGAPSVIPSGARSAEPRDLAPATGPQRREGAKPAPSDFPSEKSAPPGAPSEQGEPRDPSPTGAEGADTLSALDGQVGLGVDIVEIARMKAILARTPSFARRVFSDDERAYCEAAANPEVHFATRFAAKEAVVKALGTGFSRGIGVRDIEVRRTSKGRPYAVLSGRAKEIAAEQSVRELPISLSFTHTEAVACAMAITEDSLRAAEKRVDPMEELSRQFKEARSMLDELDAPKTPKPSDAPKAPEPSDGAPKPLDPSDRAPKSLDPSDSALKSSGPSDGAPRLLDPLAGDAFA